MNLGIKLKQLRKVAGLSLKDLSAKTNISISFLSDIENGKSNPSYEKLTLIASTLNVAVSYFLEDIEENKNVPFEHLLADPDFLTVISLLSDFKDWEENDRRELVDYLKAKRCIREYR